MAETDGRRRRPAVSCSLCRRRKIRCNREKPCNNCLRSKKNVCVYEIQASPQPSQQHLRRHQTQTDEATHSTPHGPQSSINSTPLLPRIPRGPSVKDTPANPLTPSSLASIREADSIKNKIRELEEQLSRVTPASISSPVSTLTLPSFKSSLGGTFHVHESRLFGKPQGIINSVTHKTRTFGQSHWINGAVLVRDTIELIEPYVRDDTSKIIANMKRCKNLARIIKSQRAPSWPSPPSENLPSKEVADKLVDCYLQTIESVYRILHIPSFMKDYESLWSPDAKPNPAFVVQLKLVLAIGATMYDEHFSLRSVAMRWTYEAQTWISEPRFKSMLGIQYLQILLLLLIARETADVSCEMIWISVGTLYRTAIQMGLHRDPAQLPETTTFIAEMRRRLWNTILEIAVQSSLTSGGPPLTSFDDFTTEPPGNFEDDQIEMENPVPKPQYEFTQASVAIALRATVPFRLAVTKLLNDANSDNTYEATLRLDRDLRASYKDLCQVLQRFTPNAVCLSTRYAVRLVDIIMHRYLSALHIPFFGPAFHETAYTYSRKVVIESSLKIWYLAFPTSFTAAAAAPGIGKTNPSDRDNIARLMICGSGFFRTIIFQATLSIAIELRNQSQEDQGLGPISVRPDLLSVVHGARDWCFHCIEAGETSVKGYLFLSVISAQIEGLMGRVDTEEFPELLAKAAEEAEERCLPILEAAAAAQPGVGETSEGTKSVSSNMPPETNGDWDFMMLDPMFQAGDMDPLTWTFSDDPILEPSFW